MKDAGQQLLFLNFSFFSEGMLQRSRSGPRQIFAFNCDKLTFRFHPVQPAKDLG